MRGSKKGAKWGLIYGLVLAGLVMASASTSYAGDYYVVSAPGEWAEFVGEYGDYLLYDNSPIDFYQFSVNGNRSIDIEIVSSQFDTYLFLLHFSPHTWDVYNMWQNDDANQFTTNSRLQGRVVPGYYLVGVNTYEAGMGGWYHLYIRLGW